MLAKPSDQEIVAALAEKMDVDPEELDLEYDKLGNLLKLSLAELSLTQIPSEVWQLTSLQSLYLYENGLSQLPLELKVRLNSDNNLKLR